MSCTHDCGCTPEIRDARTDEWVQIAPESARAATLTPEQPVKALPWGDGRIVRSGGGFSRSATRPRPASLSCVLTEDKPAQEPVLPRRIDPEDVRVGMVVERRKGEAAHRDRVQQIDGERIIVGTDGSWLWVPGNADGGWALWLVEDAPAPVDPPDPDAADAAFIEAIITAYRRSPECSTHAVFGESMLDHLRAQGFDVTARAEQ